MPQVNNTNIAWRNAHINLTTAKLSLKPSLQCLSLRLLINGVEDDAKALVIPFANTVARLQSYSNNLSAMYSRSHEAGFRAEMGSPISNQIL